MNDAEFLRVLSAVLAGAAVMLFIVTVVLVVKYKIISSVRLEIISRKSSRTDDLRPPEQDISGTISADQTREDQLTDIASSAADEYSGTVPATAADLQEDEYMGTVPADIRQEDNDQLFGTVPASMFSEDSNSINSTPEIPHTDPDEFVIQTDIIVIHADTALIDHLK